MNNIRQTNFVTERDVQLLTNPDLIPIKFRLIYRILFNSALRASELLTAKPDQLKKIDEKYYLELPKQKNNIQGEITPLKTEDYYSLKDYIEHNKIGPDEYIFHSKRGRHYVTWLNQKLKEHRKMVGIKFHISSHAFRRGRIIDLKNKGFDYGEIKTLTRHKSMDVLIDTYDKKAKLRASELVEK